MIILCSTKTLCAFNLWRAT